MRLPEVRIGEPEKMDELGWFTLDALPEPLHSQFLPQLPYLRRIAERDGLPYD